MKTRAELNKDKHRKIETEQNKEKKRKKTIFIFKLIAFSIIFITALFFYITYVSNLHIIVRENRIISKKIPDNFNGEKIVQFSDIHFGTTIKIDELKNLVKIINSRKPDIVVFTGDLIDKDYKLTPKEQEAIINEFKKINASIGKYAIKGEEDKEEFNIIFNQSEFSILNNEYDLIYKDYKLTPKEQEAIINEFKKINASIGKYAIKGEEDKEEFNIIFNQSEFSILNNEYDLIYKDSNNPILLIGLDNKVNINKAFKYFKEANHNSNIYTITLLHKPDTVDEIRNNYKTDLFLAGHSHNGQIRIPYLGTFLRKEGSRKYYNEHYKLDDSNLYISSGIGTNGSGIRLFTHPSINLFRLSNK